MWNYKLSGLEMSQGVLYCDVSNATNITHNKKNLLNRILNLLILVCRDVGVDLSRAKLK